MRGSLVAYVATWAVLFGLLAAFVDFTLVERTG